MKKKVALLTTFFGVMSGYSLVTVAETQIKMLLDHGYEPRVLVQENFETPPEGSVWRKEVLDRRDVVPFMHLSGGVHEDFEQRVDAIQRALEKSLKGVDVCITHDIILQSMYKEHNVAVRRYAETRPDLLWLHWIHSCPSEVNPIPEHPRNCLYTPPPGYIVYPNAVDQGAVARAYHLEGLEFKVVTSRSGHAIDPLSIWPYDKLTKDLAAAADLLAGDVVSVYPARLDRGKQPEKIIRLMHGVAAAGKEPRLLVCDWQSAGDRFQKYIDELLVLAKRLGLEGKVNFTSRLDDRCSQGVPRQVVMELLDLSNVYVHPSRIETYSLTVHEAMLRGCLCVLNHDLPMMRELWGEGGIYVDFESDRTDRTYDNEQEFFDLQALRLLAELQANRAVMAKTTVRREASPDKLWPEFAILLHKQPVGA